MTGKILTLAIVICALVAGVSMYYLQVYAYYYDVEETGQDVALTSVVTGQPEFITSRDFVAINADSSPIRFRACFQTDDSMGLLSESYELLDDAVPLLAPKWFDCFDAEAIGQDLETGAAVAFMGARNFEYGIDRVVAIYPDGRGYMWHQINDCGDKNYDGSPVDPTCPERDQ